EAIAVGRARRVALPADARERVLQFSASAPPAMKASMALDLERGNRMELPWLGGKVVALGRELGVPTPTHGMMYALLKPYIMGAPGRRASSWPGWTRLRGRSRFGEAKARPSTSFLRVGLLVHLREDRARHQASAGPGLSRRRTASKSRATLATSGPRAAPAA